MSDHVKPELAIEAILAGLSRASAIFSMTHIAGGDDWRLDCEVYKELEEAFLTLIGLTDALGLHSHLKMALATFEQARSSDGGLAASVPDPDDDKHLIWQEELTRLTRSVQNILGLRPSESMKTKLDDVLRACQYAIVDSRCFSAPKDEVNVHNRIEVILRCVFPDLLRKPAIAKPIKNFIPDTGIPSLKTLIEYKYVASMKAVDGIADEILADTRGYIDPKWTTFRYVVYETKRFKPEAEWRQFLRACGTAQNTDVIVLCGEPPSARGASRRMKSAKRAL